MSATTHASPPGRVPATVGEVDPEEPARKVGRRRSPALARLPRADRGALPVRVKMRTTYHGRRGAVKVRFDQLTVPVSMADGLPDDAVFDVTIDGLDLHYRYVTPGAPQHDDRAITATMARLAHRYELAASGDTAVIVDRMLGAGIAEPRPVAEALAALGVLEHAAAAERAAAALAQLSASAKALAERAAARHEDLRARWRDGTAL